MNPRDRSLIPPAGIHLIDGLLLDKDREEVTSNLISLNLQHANPHQ